MIICTSKELMLFDDTAVYEAERVNPELIDLNCLMALGKISNDEYVAELKKTINGLPR